MKRKFNMVGSMALVMVLLVSPLADASGIDSFKVVDLDIGKDSIVEKTDVIPDITKELKKGGKSEKDLVTLSYDNAPTNGNVLITVDVTDDASGVNKLFVTVGEGEETEVTLTGADKAKTGSFTAEANNTYKFRATDIAGNDTVANVDITNIDKVLPGLSLVADLTGPTNSDIVITATATDNVGVAKLILPDGTESDDPTTAAYTVTENGDFKFKVIDTAGNEFENSINISNISKEKPVIVTEYDDAEQAWTNQNIIVTATATDKDGGVLEIDEPSHEFEFNGSHKFTVKDKWGNIGELSVNVTKIDKVQPELEINVENEGGSKFSRKVDKGSSAGKVNKDLKTTSLRSKVGGLFKK